MIAKEMINAAVIVGIAVDHHVVRVKVNAASNPPSAPEKTTDQPPDLSVMIPPLHEQTTIAIVPCDRNAELAALEQRRDKIRTLKLGMMQELLTGRICLV